MKKKKGSVLILALFCVFAIALLFPGCAIKEPTAKIRSVQVEDITLKKVKLNFTVHIKNPNDVRIKVKKLSYSLSAFGKRLVRDTTDKAIEIPPKEKVFFDLPVTVRYSKLVSAGISTIKKGKLEYSLNATITLDTPVGDISLPLQKSGTVKIKQLGKMFDSFTEIPQENRVAFEETVDAGDIFAQVDSIEIQ